MQPNPSSPYLARPVQAPKQSIFYGWWIVGAAALCQFVFLSVSHVSVGVLLRPVTGELGWPAWAFTLGSSLAVICGVFSGILVGKVVDRRGPRRLMLVGSIVSGLCLYALGRQSDLWLFWIFHGICGLVGWNLFGPLVVNAILNKWFVAKRGWALAVGSVGISLAGMITPVVLTAIVDDLGWRAGYTSLAVFVLVVVTPAALVMRRTPEDHGLHPDGLVPAPVDDDSAESAKPGLSRAQAVRTLSFWMLAAGFGLNAMALTSILVHAIPFATHAGFSRATASIAVSVAGLGNLSSKAVWAFALQRVGPRPLVMAAYSTSAVGALCMLAATTSVDQMMLMAGFFLYGFGFGGTIPLTEFLWATYFGRENIGAIRGISQPVSSLGSSFGPVLVGLWFDQSHTYLPAFATLVGVYVCAGILIGLSREPVLARS